MKTDKKEKIENQIKEKAYMFYKEVASGKRYSPYLLIRIMYSISKFILKKYADEDSLDKKYWIEKGWYTGEKNPFKA